MIDVIITKPDYKMPLTKAQNELHADTIENFSRMLPEKFTALSWNMDPNLNVFERLKQTIYSGKGDIVIVADAGVLLNKPLEPILKKFYENDKIGIIGCRLVDCNYDLVDAGVEHPEQPQPIWRRFGQSPDVAELLNEDYNIYIDAKFIIMRKTMLEQVSIKPEAQLFWALFLCWEASRAGWSVYYSPEEVLYTNHWEKNISILDDIYTDSQKWFIDTVKIAYEEDKKKAKRPVVITPKPPPPEPLSFLKDSEQVVRKGRGKK